MMLNQINDFPNQIRNAWRLITNQIFEPIDIDRIENIIVAGMGGSAIGGDLVAGLLQDELPVSIFVHRNGGLPAWADERTLVIASSYSGNTWETLSAWEAAQAVGALRLAITTGGELADSARTDKGAALLAFEYEAQPRAALGYSLTLMLGTLHGLGLINDPTSELQAAVDELEPFGALWADTNATDNRARDLAGFCAEGIPFILGAEHLSTVARRWTTQINENAKSWAFWNEYPELNHNIIVGFQKPESTASDHLIRPILLTSEHVDSTVAVQQRVTGQLFDRQGIEWRSLPSPMVETRLAELLWFAWLGDYVSYHLADCYQVDPTPVEAIDYLKSQMSLGAQ
ncbi:hypothetical protein DZK26_05850 [Wenzhouxiangella sp. 15190]|nr:hypothetical protein DZK26_05850 [Wenzhouxiangella sp. 15190]